ncbi:MAG: NPCBM/NEW2 domain-containing protein [Armatimonadota bacterium]
MNSAVCSSDQSRVEYLSDLQHRFLYVQQGWGKLGIDTAAYSGDKPVQKIRIKDRDYSKGIGHHAPGEIVVELNGEYEWFEADIGVQWQGGNVGSVVFQVFVDDEERFCSGVMRELDDPKPVHISVKDASELRLVVGDAGDGITCDCANWSNARLVRSATASKMQPPKNMVDIAQFAKVVTSDPHRKQGTSATRIQEFPAKDLFLDREIAADSNSVWKIPVYSNIGCIGLQWIEDRRLKEIGIQLPEQISSDRVKVEYWAGQSEWQGEWKSFSSPIVQDGTSFCVKVDYSVDPQLRDGTRKIRWLLYESQETLVARRLSAFTNSRWEEVDIFITLEEPQPGRIGQIEAYNGEFVAEERVKTVHPWDLGKSLHLKVRYSKPRPWKSDRTVLRVVLPENAFGIAIDDLLANEFIYVRDARVFASCKPLSRTCHDYLESIKGRKTILEHVRELPDQTLSQALTMTRNPIQSSGPAMVSLACDNIKFVVTREGAIQFPLELNQPADRPPEGAVYRAQIAPKLTNPGDLTFNRCLHSGWLPAPVEEWSNGRIKCTQRTFVVPFGEKSFPEKLNWLNDKPLCVSEFVIINLSTEQQKLSMEFEFLADWIEHMPLGVVRKYEGVVAESGGRLVAFLDFSRISSGLKFETHGCSASIAGKLPPGLTYTFTLFIPGWEVGTDSYTEFLGVEGLIDRFENYWRHVLAGGMQFDIPDEFLTNLIRASLVYCFIAARNEERGQRVAPWIASMSYGPLESEANSIVTGMCFMGFEEFTKCSLDFFINRYNEQGFLTTGYTLMGTGWHLWSLGKFYELYRAQEWMRSVAPKVAEVCKWISRQREKTKQLDPNGNKVPEYGLVPPGVLADWGLYAYHYCLEGYYYAGLRWAAQALSDIEHSEAGRLIMEAEEFRSEILRAFHWTQSKTPVVPLRDGTWVPGYPAQVYTFGSTGDYYPGQDANRSWAYDVELGVHQLVPQGVLDASSCEVDYMMDHMEDVQFLRDGWLDYPAEKSEADWFNLGGFAKMQPYYCRNAEIYALRDDVKPFIRSYFNTLASLVNTETMWFWEHFNASGAWNKTHETGYFLQQTRFMLVMEHGDELWLAPLVTNNWMKDGMSVNVAGAPTQFGTVSYRIDSNVNAGYIEAQINPPKRSIPKSIVIRLRHPDGKKIKSVTVNGKASMSCDPVKEIVRISITDTSMITLRAYY